MRAAIAELLSRDNEVPTNLLFVLKAMLRAEAIATTHEVGRPFIGGATFDMGAGVLLTAVAWRFASPATPVVLVEHIYGPRYAHETRSWIDGGDLVVEVSEHRETRLEGSAPWLGGRRRRAAEAAKAAADAAAEAAQAEQEAWDDD